MSISFLDFIHYFINNPALRITTILILGVILVNGWTDAPNAIATCVATGALEMEKAIRMAALFNFAGILFMTTINAKVASTIYHIVDFGSHSQIALTALCAAMTAIIVWAAGAWYFGIPTSESHALIAGLSGASIAIYGGTGGIHGTEWIKVLYGLLFSLVLGVGLGICMGKLVSKTKQGHNYGKAQIASAAAMAFMHGAQDGQKFMGVFMLGIFLAKGQTEVTNFKIPFWMMLLCSITMFLGTAIGGRRIIQTVGVEMVELKSPQGFAADMAGVVCLFLSTVIGIPVSTTHVKTTAIMGVGAASDISHINKKIVKEMILAWILTFPGCGLIGYLMAKFFMKIILYGILL